MAIEVPPIDADANPADESTVGAHPWLTTRDDDASYWSMWGHTTNYAERVLWPDIPAGTPLSFAIRAKSDNAATSRWLNVFYGSTFTSTDYFTVPTTWTDLGPLDAIDAIAPGGSFWMELSLEGFSSSSTDNWHLTYIALLLPGGALPPLRQFPRDDELGTASARRIWPTSSHQASLRRLGGYY